MKNPFTYIVLILLFASNLLAGQESSSAADIESGKSFYQQREFDSAYFYFNLAIQADSTNDYAWFSRALTKEKLRDNEGAISDYRMAASINPKPIYYNNIGMIYTVQEYHDMALIEYTRALEIDSTYPQALFNKGISYHHLGMKEEACKFVGKAKEYGLELADQYLEQFCQ